MGAVSGIRLLLAALLIAATAIFVAVAGDSRAQPLRLALQVYLLSVAAVYFVWSWSGGRRTLAMRTWRLRLVDARGNSPDARTALVRFLVLVLSLPIGAAGFWWALVDRDRLYLRNANVPHAIKTTFAYEIPVGRGKRFGTDMNKYLNAFIGNWDVNGTGRIQWRMFNFRGKVVGIVIHVVTVGGLAGAAVPAAIVSDDAIALIEKEQHLRIPVIGRQRPAMTENDGLTLAPILVVNLDAVFGRDCAHGFLPLFVGGGMTRGRVC